MAETQIDKCLWPPLPEPYAQALKDAVAFVLGRFDPLGMIAAGSVIAGNPDPSSDLDLYVVNSESKRQRIQKFFNGVPCEIFINPAKTIEGYLSREQREGRPVTAHMLVTGFVILDTDPAVEQLRQRGREVLAGQPNPDELQLTILRYAAAFEYEDAVDVSHRDPAAANMLLSSAVRKMLHYSFMKSNRYIPRDKDLLESLRGADSALGASVIEFYKATDLDRRLELAEIIAKRTIETHGFFEWDSPLEEV